MSRIESVSVEKATGATEKLYAVIKSQLGGVPNLFQALGSNPKVLEIQLGLGAATKSLSSKEKESISLVVAQENDCAYCLAAHTALGKMVGLKESEIISARKGKSEDRKLNALLQFAKEVINHKGNVSDATFIELKAAGYTDSQIPEILMSILSDIFTNYFNRFNETEIDFQKATSLEQKETL